MIKRKCCVFTCVKNEKVFLPIWLKYYSKFFHQDDIYVLDHETSDGSVGDCLRHYQFNVSVIRNEFFDVVWKTKVISQKQVELLQFYEYVLYTDVDEFVIPDPRKYKDLKDYIMKCEKDCVICAGYDMIHMRQLEPPIDLTRPILKQRGYWRANHFYCKPLLSKIALDWRLGNHKAMNVVSERDKNLWLMHLHKFDFDLSWEKHLRIKSFKHNPDCITRGLSWQYRIDNLKDFEAFFYTRHLYKERLRMVSLLRRINIALLIVSHLTRKPCLLKADFSLWDKLSYDLQLIIRMPRILIETEII